MSEPISHEPYLYRGVELKPHMLCELAEKHFPPGSILQRKWLIQEGPRIHLELGGKATVADPTAQAKKARKTLLAGNWEEAGYGNIRRLGAAQTSTSDFPTEPLFDDSDVGASLIAEEWFGVGEETVYCYTFPSYLELAMLKGSKALPMKIGKTSSTTLDRVSLQCGVSNPEQPVVPLAIRVENATAYERAIHRILTIWNRWIEDAPGTEWFMTSKDEILSIIRFLNSPPDPVTPSNNGVETDA
jgi:hypothetical protein